MGPAARGHKTPQAKFKEDELRNFRNSRITLETICAMCAGCEGKPTQDKLDHTTADGSSLRATLPWKCWRCVNEQNFGV